MPLLRGRAFTPSDTVDSPPVAIINETLARRYFPDDDPIGHRLRYPASDTEAPWIEIVGVVGNEIRPGLHA